MEQFTNPIVWLHRIRHRCGYGIHSPHAFSFVTGVVYEKLPFYPYRELDASLPFSYRFRQKKILHLLFRIANHYQPGTTHINTADSYVKAYIQAGCRKASHVDGNSQIDLCYLSQPDDTVISRLHDDSILILDNLRQNQEWFHALPSVVSYDLWDTGIACFNPKYNKQHYIINF